MDSGFENVSGDLAANPPKKVFINVSALGYNITEQPYFKNSVPFYRNYIVDFCTGFIALGHPGHFLICPICPTEATIGARDEIHFNARPSPPRSALCVVG